MKGERNSFIVYYELEEQTKSLTDEQLGKLFRGMFVYQKQGKKPVFDDERVQISFEFVKTYLDINDQKYKERCRINAENGKKGGRPKKIDIKADIDIEDKKIRKRIKKLMKKNKK